MLIRTLLFIGITSFLVLPLAAWAHPGSWLPLVTCGGPGQPPCSGATGVCELLHTGQHILVFLIWIIAVPAATIGILIGGTLLLIAGGNEALVSKGRNALKFAVAGLVVVLISFIVINAILSTIANQGAFPWPWYQIRC